MHVDIYGLPCQVDGNCENQLSEAALISLAGYLNAKLTGCKDLPTDIEVQCDLALSDPMGLLMHSPGVYMRHTLGGPGDVTCDQLIPTLAYHVVMGDRQNISLMFKAMLKRFGFAQNVHTYNDPTTKANPELMMLRALPLFTRYSKWLYPLTLVADLCLIVGVLSILIKDNSLEPADDGSLIVTLLCCLTTYPTFVTKLAALIYKHLRAINPSALICHNNEIAEMYQTLIKEHLS